MLTTHSAHHNTQIVANENLGHPLCDNVRAGNWLLEYTATHLAKYVSAEHTLATLWRHKQGTTRKKERD